MCANLQVWRDRACGSAVQQSDRGELLQLRQDRSSGERVHHWSVRITVFSVAPPFRIDGSFLSLNPLHWPKAGIQRLFPGQWATLSFVFLFYKGVKNHNAFKTKMFYLGRGVMYNALLKDPFQAAGEKILYWDVSCHADLWAHSCEPQMKCNRCRREFWWCLTFCYKEKIVRWLKGVWRTLLSIFITRTLYLVLISSSRKSVWKLWNVI